MSEVGKARKRETDVQVGATTSFNIVALANVPAETHVNEAWAAGIQQSPISQAFNITLSDAIGHTVG